MTTNIDMTGAVREPGSKRKLTRAEADSLGADVQRRRYERKRREAHAAGKPKPPPKRVTWAEAAKRIGKGIVGLAKVELGIDPAGPEVVKARLAICEACELSTPADQPVIKRRCGKLLEAGKGCGCWLSKKPKIAGQSCPLAKW